MNRASVLLALPLVIGAAAACQAQPQGSSCVASQPAGGPAGCGAGIPSDPRPSQPATTDAPVPSPTLDTDAPAEIDASLLDYLPASVGDIPIAENLDEAAVAVSDPTIAEIATAVDVGFALDEARGNLVTAHVVRLRAGAFDDATYRDWRDTFDEGACARAGGVRGHGETTVDDRTVYVTTCVAPLRTYHLWLADADLLVSVTSVGSGDFGELLVQELRLP